MSPPSRLQKKPGGPGGARAVASRRQRKGRAAEAPPDAAASPGPLERAGVWVALAALLLPPFVVALGLREPFRLPKQLLTELLVPLSIALLAFGLRRVERVEWRAVVELPAVRALLPLWLVAVLSRLASAHADEGLWSLSIGMLAIVGWSVALPHKRRALDLLVIPAGALALLAVLAHHQLFRPFDLARATDRLQMTSLAGNVADLGAYLVLPLLIGQAGLARALAGGRRLHAAGWALGLGFGLYTLLIGRTLSALAAALVASCVFWLLRAAARWRVPLLIGATLATLLGVALVAPVRERVVGKLDDVREGRLNDLLTGRLDGWRAGAAMLAAHPVLGVGPGAYRAEFAPVKLALEERGVDFWRGHTAGSQFGNAHSEPIELGAELGGLGLIALAWAVWVLLGRLRHRPLPAPLEPRDADRRALQWAGLAALGVLALTYFPLRTALVAYPYVLLLAWLLEPPARVPASSMSAASKSGETRA